MRYGFLQQKFDKRLQDAEEAIQAAINMPLVFNQEEAEKIGKGFQKIAKIPDEEWDKIEASDIPNMLKEFSDGNVRFAAVYVDKALSLITDAYRGTIYQNPSLHKLHDVAKDMATLRREGAGTMVIDNVAALQYLEGIDSGWLPAFVQRDGTNADELKVIDWRGALRFREYKYHTDRIVMQSLGSVSSQRFGPRYFASGFEYGEREIRWTVFSVNEVLRMMRAEADAIATRLHYMKLAEIGTGTRKVVADSSLFADGANDLEKKKGWIERARHTLNMAHFETINAAAQIPKGKKANPSLEVPLRVTASTPLICYVNHGHFQALAAIQGMTGGIDGINTPLSKPYVFVESTLMPMSGGHTITDTDEVQEDTGFYGKTKEAAADIVGMMGIIPRARNNSAVFRNVTFRRAAEPINELRQIAAKFEINCAVDRRQQVHINLGQLFK